MKCELFRNKRSITGPIIFVEQRIRDIVARQGVAPNLVPTKLSKKVTIGTIEIKPIRDVKPPCTNAETYVSVERREEDDAVFHDHIVGPKDVDVEKVILNKDLSAYHDLYENDYFLYRGILIKADKEARVNAMGTNNLFKDGVLTSVLWRGKTPSDKENIPTSKLENGKIPIADAAEMAELYGAIVSRLDKGFTSRSMVEDTILALVAPEVFTYNVRSEFDAIATV